MTSLIQLNRQLYYLFIALLLACVAIAQSARAVTPEPDGGDANGSTAEEDNALPELSTDTQNAAMGNALNHPNDRVIPIELRTPQCGCDRVQLRGELHIQFGVKELRNGERQFQPVEEPKLENFTAKALSTFREYKVVDVAIVKGRVQTTELNGLGAGEFKVGIVLHGRPPTGRGTSDPCPTEIIKFLVIYKVTYEFREHKVTGLNPGRPEVNCIVSPAGD